MDRLCVTRPAVAPEEAENNKFLLLMTTTTPPQSDAASPPEAAEAAYSPTSPMYSPDAASDAGAEGEQKE